MRFFQKLFICFAVLVLPACGYDVVLNYETDPALSYRIDLKEEDINEVKEFITNEFRDAGLEFVVISDIGGVVSCSFEDDVSRIYLQIHHDEGFERITIGLFARRKISRDTADKSEFDRRKSAIRGIVRKLEVKLN